MEQSILKSTKTTLHLNPDDDSFDLNVLTWINSAFSDLSDLGVGPQDGFEVQDDGPTWEDYIPDDKIQRSQVRTFVLLKARLSFDPPNTSYLVTSAERQLAELTSRISIRRENAEYTDPPAPVPVLPDE